MFISKLLLFIVLITNLYNSSCEISDKRLCVDDKCSVPVSLAKTLLRYSSPDPEGLSFAPNQEVKIFSKEAGSTATLWGAEINGKRGYIPKNLVREYRILNKPTKLVATKVVEEPQVPNTSVKPDKPLEPYEIIDGTKLYMNLPEEQDDSQDNISSSEVLEKPSEQEAAEKVDDNIPNEGKNADINSTLVEHEHKDSKLKIEESETSSFVTYSLSLEQKQPEQSTSDQPNKSSPVETSDVKSPVEGKSLSSEKLSTDEESPVNEPITTKEKSLLEEVPSTSEEKSSTNEQKSANEETALSDDSPAVEVTSSSNTEQKITTEETTSVEKKTDGLESASEASKLEDNLGISELENNSTLLSKDMVSSEDSKAEVESKEIKNSHSDQTSSEETDSTGQQTKDISKADMSSSLNSLPPTYNPTEEIRDSSTEITIKDFEPVNSNAGLKEQADNLENNLPPTLLPIFPLYPASLDNLVTPAPNIPESEEMLKQNIELSEHATELNSNIPSFLDNESKENDSGEVFNSNQEDTMLPKADLSQPFEEKTLIPESQSADDNQGYLSSKINDFNNDKEEKISDNNEEFYHHTPEGVIAQQEPKVEDLPVQEQVMFEDNTAAEKKIDVSNEQTEQSDFEELPSEESPGMFSFFTNFFDWSGTPEKINENSEIDKIDERNLKCDANIDQFSFNLNSNLMMHLITTIVVFVTFLLFYLSVNKHRIESPLVAKINQLEKDLLVMIKEKEALGEKGFPDARNDFINSEELIQLNQRLGQVSSEKGDLEMQLNALKEELEKKDGQIESLEKELETSTEVGLELNRLISEVLDPSVNGNEKLKENVEQFQKQLQEQTEVIKSMSARLKAKEFENVELLLEIEETKKNAASVQERIQDLVEKVTSIEREKDAQQNALQSEIGVYQSNYNELVAKNEALNNEIQIVKTKLANSEREIALKIKECNNLKESFKDISSMKNDNKTLNSILDTITMKAEYDQMKSDLEKYARELQQNQSEKAIIENKYQSIVQEINDLKNKYQEIDKEKLETDMKLEVLNNYFKNREMELQEEVLKYKSIWDAKEGEATSTTERIKLLQEEIENYKSQSETLKQEILSQEIALKGQITVLEKKAHENWVSARQSERKLEDARQEAAQLRNRLTFRQRNINEEMVQNGLDQNDTSMSSQPSMYSPASPPLFYDNGRDQVTKSPIPGLPPFLPPPPGAPFVPPPVPNLPGMALPPHFMPPLPAGFPGDHRPPPLGRMSSPPIKSRYSPDASAFSPYERGSPSPIYDSEYGGGPYRNYSPYNSEDDRRGYRSPSPLTRTKTKPSKGSVTAPKVNRSNESLDKTNSKKSNMV